uniref:Uncharacterized protein n=1 Tax=Anguilla anguilla TaxID=7936 RepID=A0A0E9VUN5_ANGAN
MDLLRLFRFNPAVKAHRLSSLIYRRPGPQSPRSSNCKGGYGSR